MIGLSNAKKALVEAQKSAHEEVQKEFEEALKETTEKDVPTQNENTQVNDNATIVQGTTNDPSITDIQPAAPVTDNERRQSNADEQVSTDSASITSDNGAIGKAVDVSA